MSSGTAASRLSSTKVAIRMHCSSARQTQKRYSVHKQRVTHHSTYGRTMKVKYSLTPWPAINPS